MNDFDHVEWLADYLRRLQKNEQLQAEELIRAPRYSLVPSWEDLLTAAGVESDPDETFVDDLPEDVLLDVASRLDIPATLDQIAQFDPGDTPLWSVSGGAAIVEDEWLVHCSDHADDIVGDGFTRGMPWVEHLALTTHAWDKPEEPGFNFAYTVGDFERYGLTRAGHCKYGRGIVLVKVPKAMVFRHWLDQEPQAIFWGPDATCIFPLYMRYGRFSTDDLWQEDEYGDEVEVETDELDDLIEAIELALEKKEIAC